MNITKDVIKDLLPVYLSGEATPATCNLVEDYLRDDPSFAIEVAETSKVLSSLSDAAPPEAGLERAALKRTKRELLKQKILIAVGSTLTLNAISLGFSFEIGKGVFRVHWLALPGQMTTVLALAAASAALWAYYFAVSRRIRIHILG
ncbi:MAG TPA: hypothetical protein VGL66_01830 [Caulobacteraceae bacterium]|jgi:hypothetical protein